MKETFSYLGRKITVYGVDVFHWHVLIDGSKLMFLDSPATFSAKITARQTAHEFVQHLSEDEV